MLENVIPSRVIHKSRTARQVEPRWTSGVRVDIITTYFTILYHNMLFYVWIGIYILSIWGNHELLVMQVNIIMWYNNIRINLWWWMEGLY